MKIKDGFIGQRVLIIPKLIQDNFYQDPLLSALCLTDIGFFPKALYHYRKRDIPIEENILIYCTQGKGFCRVKDKEFDIKENQYIIIPSGLPHYYKSDIKEPWTIYWIHFKGTLASQYIDTEINVKEILPSEVSRISERLKLFEEIFYLIQNNMSLDNLRYSSSLLHNFLGSLKFISQYRIQEKDDTPLLELILHYMMENIHTKLTSKELANKVNMPESTLYRFFKNQTGYSLIKYFNLLKIQKACELMQSSSMKLNQVCHKVGITDPYYFSRLFRQIMGMSPKQYKAKFLALN